jgi:hypothetical protein
MEFLPLLFLPTLTAIVAGPFQEPSLDVEGRALVTKHAQVWGYDTDNSSMSSPQQWMDGQNSHQCLNIASR